MNKTVKFALAIALSLAISIAIGINWLTLYLLFIMGDILFTKLTESKNKGRILGEIKNWENILLSKKVTFTITLIGGGLLIYIMIFSGMVEYSSFEVALYVSCLIFTILISLFDLKSNVKIYEQGVSLGKYFANYENIEVGESFNGEVIVELHTRYILTGSKQFKLDSDSEDFHIIEDRVKSFGN